MARISNEIIKRLNFERVVALKSLAESRVEGTLEMVVLSPSQSGKQRNSMPQKDTIG